MTYPIETIDSVVKPITAEVMCPHPAWFEAFWHGTMGAEALGLKPGVLANLLRHCARKLHTLP